MNEYKRGWPQQDIVCIVVCVCERVQLFMASEFSLWRGGVVINIIAVDEHLFGSLAPLSFGYEMQSKCECWCGVEWKSES